MQTEKKPQPCPAVQSRVPHCPVSIFATPAIPAPGTDCKSARTGTRQKEFDYNAAPDTTCQGVIFVKLVQCVVPGIFKKI